ncbi:MAG: hypothetical protein QW303_00630 [Nitrososphaerota archaeon]
MDTEYTTHTARENEIAFVCSRCRRRLILNEELKLKDVSKFMTGDCRRSVLLRLPRFINSLLNWIKQTLQLASLDTINKRFSICKKCEFFVENLGSDTGHLCGNCLCRISTKRNILNKLAIPTEKCPVGRW